MGCNKMKKWDAIQLLSMAQALKDSTYKEHDEGKLGTYRGGNAGHVTNGIPVGECPRLIYLRTTKGVQFYEDDDITLHGTLSGESSNISSKNLMFDGGLANEFVWQTRLESVLGKGERLLCEEDLSLSAEHEGMIWSGRPDQVICLEDPLGKLTKDGISYRPVHLLEHKGVYSTWVARSVLLQGKPKMKNVMQTAIYSYHLGKSCYKDDFKELTAELIYTNYDNFVLSETLQKIVPRFGTEGSEWISYKFKKARVSTRADAGFMLDDIDEEEFLAHYEEGKKLKVFSKKNVAKDIYLYQAVPNYIKPFVVSFNVRVCHDLSIEWKRRDSHRWERTGTYVNDIWSLYGMAEDMKKKEDFLPPKPIMVDAFGKEEKFSLCSYCPADKICKKAKSRGVWEGAILGMIQEKEKT